MALNEETPVADAEVVAEAAVIQNIPESEGIVIPESDGIKIKQS